MDGTRSGQIDYDGKRFGTGDGVLAEWTQRGDLVTASFAGGPVLAGALVGRVGLDGAVRAAYCQLLTDGTRQAGEVTSTPVRLPDGRFRLAERWRRLDGAAGISWIEELP